MHQLVSFSSTQRKGSGRSRENAHGMCDLHNPIEVEFNLVNRVIVIRNNGSSDSPSVLTNPASFRGSERGRVGWMVRSIGTISSASLSMNDTGTPEFVNRIYIPSLVRSGGGVKRRRTLQGASGVSGRTILPARRGKLDKALPSATLNLSISKISGITWAVGTCSRAGG